MPATYEPIATTTLSSSGDITFTSIPGTYTDLRLVVVGKATTSGGLGIRFNSDGGANYSHTWLRGNGTAASSSRETSNTHIGGLNIDSTQPNLFTFDIFSYAGSTNKTVLAETSQDTNGGGNVYRIVGLWRNTGAITSIRIFEYLGYSLASGTTATLYGILKA